MKLRFPYSDLDMENVSYFILGMAIGFRLIRA